MEGCVLKSQVRLAQFEMNRNDAAGLEMLSALDDFKINKII